MKRINSWVVIGAACGSVAVAAVVTNAVGQGSFVESGAGSEMQTGVTITQGATDNSAPLEKAVPSITGPAPLPVEEQGLPG
jgi:hypothetical protein